MTGPLHQRTVATLIHPEQRRHGPGLTTTDLGGPELADTISPFLVVSLYDMAGPTFPPHPHAGFSVATYILPESPIGFINHDTLGNRNRIAPGALHVTVAGSGVQHEEQPERTGALARGFQIWIDHAEGARDVAPHALHLRADDVPVVRDGGAVVRVVLGSAAGRSSPLAIPTPVRLVDVTLEAGASFRQDLNDGETAFVMVLSGDVLIAGTEVAAGTVAVTDRVGAELPVSAGPAGARLILFAGQPLAGEPRVQRGPFVASSSAQLQGFMTRFAATGFGTLTPFAAQPDWQPNDGQVLARLGPGRAG